MLNKNIISNYHIKCPCCNEGTINSQYDICLVCGWEDDIVQNEDENFSGGANKMSLIEHRQNFLEQRKKNPNYKWGNNCRYVVNYKNVRSVICRKGKYIK